MMVYAILVMLDLVLVIAYPLMPFAPIITLPLSNKDQTKKQFDAFGFDYLILDFVVAETELPVIIDLQLRIVGFSLNKTVF